MLKETNAARFRKGLQASRYVDPVSLDIILRSDDVTQIYPDAQYDRMREGGQAGGCGASEPLLADRTRLRQGGALK